MTHPRRDLSFNCSRRTFFRALLQEVFVIHDSIQGEQTGRLSALGSLPDDELAQVRPVVAEQCETFVAEDGVWARYELKEQPPVKLFSTEEKEKAVVFTMFDGQHSLGEIAGHLARETALDEATAFAHVRDLFLSLVERAVCHPKDPPQPDR